MTGQWFIETATGDAFHYDEGDLQGHTAEYWVAAWAARHGPGQYIILGEDGHTPKLPGMKDAEVDNGA